MHSIRGRRAIQVVAIALTIGLTTLACAKSTPNPSTPPTTAPAKSPAETLRDSLAALKTAPVHSVDKTETAVGVVTIAGDIDLPNKAVSLAVTSAQVIEIRLLGNDLYVKAPGMAKPWTHVDMTKLGPDSAMRGALDSAADNGLLGGIVSVTQTGPGRYEGTADLHKAADAAATKSNKENLQAQAELAGAAASSLPFQASVDEQGRLTSISYQIASAKAGTTKHTVTFADWGKPVTVSRPAPADVAEATAEQYAQF